MPVRVEESPTLQHRVHIPSSALQRSREEEVLVMITVLNSSLFMSLLKDSEKTLDKTPLAATRQQPSTTICWPNTDGASSAALYHHLLAEHRRCILSSPLPPSAGRTPTVHPQQPFTTICWPNTDGASSAALCHHLLAEHRRCILSSPLPPSAGRTPTLSPPPRARGRMLIPDQSAHLQGTVMGQLVLAVRRENGTCVFWRESVMEDGTGHWSKEGCDTTSKGNEFICTCNHLSFFAVLVNPVISVDQTNAVTLSYITYVGSALSVIFTVISLVVYICLQWRRPEKAVGVHMQLTGALFCLHLSFLLCSLLPRLQGEKDVWVCRVLGPLLHWSLLATFSWTALEGFHLYLLLVRVFNIYVRRYMLKLSLLGWGVPTVIAVVCGISGVYGEYSLVFRDATNHTSTAEICWISSHFPHRILVSYITVVAYLGLVLLINSSMLGLVVVKLWALKETTGGTEGSGGKKKMHRENRAKLWKNCATLLGLSCVLGLPWGFAFSTYSSFSLPGLYLFTIFNALQGVFMFMWSLALTCKSRSDNNSSVKDPSTQKMMETSFNN
ncbi:adhesion G protein-coupled receptor G3-like [Diretmus argenteus]